MNLHRAAVDEDTKTARVRVAADQLSLAIGNNGQNVRLAAKLTGWKITIEAEDAVAAVVEEAVKETE